MSGPAQLADKVWSWLPPEDIEPGAMTQIQNVAALPCTAHVAVMPDAHKGYGMPIGCALATRAAVVPYAVGVDIGCGMIAVKTSLGTSWPRENIQAALVGIFARVPVGQPKRDRNRGSFTDRQNSSVLREWFEERGPRDPNAHALRERADRQLGTLGGGNHFIELQSDETNLWLMLHTGSRAFGKHVCDYYHAIAVRECDRHYTPLPDKELAFLLLDSVDGKDYMLDMQFAMRFAEESRARIKTQALEALTETFGAFDVLDTIETHHNFAAVEQHLGKPLVVHRKGAVRTTKGPLVTIPGSMQTGSYIGRGIPNVLALDTCSHGAGRRLGRNQTRRDNVGVDIKAEMAAEGIELVCPPDSDALDEAGRAYKDIENVMRYQADLVEPVVKLTPLGVVKG
jgi:tRNA-splicing ligase RtcB